MGQIVTDCPRCGAAHTTLDVYAVNPIPRDYDWQSKWEAFAACRHCSRSSILVRVIVADWDGQDAASTLTHSEARIVLGRARAFVEESIDSRFYNDLENSSEAYALSKELYQRREHLSRCRVYLVTDKVLSGRTRDFPEGRVGTVPVEFHIWDIARFHRVSESSSGRDDLEIDFGTRMHGGVPCIAASVDSDDYKAYLCVIRGDVLANDSGMPRLTVPHSALRTTTGFSSSPKVMAVQ